MILENYDLVIIGSGEGSKFLAWQNFASSGAELILGSGRFLGERTVEVTLPDGTSRTLRGTRVVVGTGTHATIPSIPGLSDVQPLTHVEALELDEVPAHLLVLGGGYVRLEIAQAMRRFGSRVTVLESHDRLLAREDEDVQGAIRALLTDEGIEVVLGAKITAVSRRSGASVEVSLEGAAKRESIQGTHLLVSTGRSPNTTGLGLELAGVELDGRGYVKVNEKLETTAPGVWAIGEVAGSPQFTHIAFDDFRIIRDNFDGGSRFQSFVSSAAATFSKCPRLAACRPSPSSASITRRSGRSKV
jgi:pyruvate/2-oxoglutarate dehydrogenase complex dihydrolipoamide dehydrogenase (E3) component